MTTPVARTTTNIITAPVHHASRIEEILQKAKLSAHDAAAEKSRIRNEKEGGFYSAEHVVRSFLGPG